MPIEQMLSADGRCRSRREAVAGKAPYFILDPWQRARPDIFEFEGFQTLWPVSSARNEKVKL